MACKQHWLRTIFQTAALVVAVWAAGGVPAMAATGSAQDLGRALQLFYDGDYARALPIFQGLKDGDETLDLLFWTGVSAGRSGQCSEAKENLKELLSLKPDMLRARLELGVAYYNCRDYGEAKAQFDALLASNPPPEMRNLAKNYLVKIAKQKRRLAWNVRFSQGGQYDGNVNSAPDDLAIATAQESGNWLTDLFAGLRYDVGEPAGLLVAGDFSFYYRHSFEDSAYHYIRAILKGGPWWQGKKDLVRAPIGYMHKSYGGTSLSNSFLFRPDIEHFFTETLSLYGGYKLTVERYAPDDYKDGGYDNEDHRFSIGPNFYMNDRQYAISSRYEFRLHDADQDQPSYTDHGLSLAFMAAFKTNTELMLQYKWTDRSYDDNWGDANKDRDDSRHSVTAAVAQTFLDNYFVAAELIYVNNGSNYNLYEFDKTAFTISVGLNY